MRNYFFISKNQMKCLVVVLIEGIHFMTYGQILLPPTNIAQEGNLERQCYHIVLDNQGKNDLKFSAQDYRLNGDYEIDLLLKASFNFLALYQCTAVKSIHHLFDADVSVFGTLPYVVYHKFIHLSTDLNLSEAGGVTIPYGKNIATEFRFLNVKKNNTPLFTWAKDHWSLTYATAFEDIAMPEEEQLKKVKTVDCKIAQNSITTTQLAVFDLKYFPNPYIDKMYIQFNQSLPSDAMVTIKDVFRKVILRNIIQNVYPEYITQIKGLPNVVMIIEIKTEYVQISLTKYIKMPCWST
jgi:hypothetical protein